LSTPDRASAHTLTLLTRAECGLCEDMLNELQALRARHELPPIRLLDEVPVCSARLDQAELLRALRDRPGTA
jgi:hypothetical protein